MAAHHEGEKGLIVVLDMPLLDTRQSRDLTVTIIADNLLQLLSYVAQIEREFIRQRLTEGNPATKKRGVTFGRRNLECQESYPSVKERWKKCARLSQK